VVVLEKRKGRRVHTALVINAHLRGRRRARGQGKVERGTLRLLVGGCDSRAVTVVEPPLRGAVVFVEHLDLDTELDGGRRGCHSDDGYLFRRRARRSLGHGGRIGDGDGLGSGRVSGNGLRDAEACAGRRDAPRGVCGGQPLGVGDGSRFNMSSERHYCRDRNRGYRDGDGFIVIGGDSGDKTGLGHGRYAVSQHRVVSMTA